MVVSSKTLHSQGHISCTCLFLLLITITFVISSLFYGLCSVIHPSFIERNFLPSSMMNAFTDKWVRPNRSQEQFHMSMTESAGLSVPQGIPRQDRREKCTLEDAMLKIFMYNLPPEFHFGLLDWKDNSGRTWPDIRDKIPDYPGGLNLQHSIEYWLTLDLLSSRFPDKKGHCIAVRVDNSSEADLIFVPFFSSLCYNRFSKVASASKNKNKLLQQRLVTYLTHQEEWKRSGGRDHIVLAHHPNSMLDARRALWPAIFILSDFGRYPPTIANVEKDVIAPYKHMVKSYINDSLGFDSRSILLYFQGAIYRKDGGFIRQELFYLLKDEKDVHFSFGTVQKNGVNEASRGMHSSKFCLNIAGDTPSSNRLFDAIVSHCVPVIISDDIELPYEDVLDYSKFCVFVRTSDALKEGFLVRLIRSIGKEEWTHMWKRLKAIEHHFEFQYPSQNSDAVQMIWMALARKLSAVKLQVHRFRRYSRYSKVTETNVKQFPVEFP